MRPNWKEQPPGGSLTGVALMHSLARRYHPQARRTHLIEQDQPFDADEVVAKAEKWADLLES